MLSAIEKFAASVFENAAGAGTADAVTKAFADGEAVVAAGQSFAAKLSTLIADVEAIAAKFQVPKPA